MWRLWRFAADSYCRSDDPQFNRKPKPSTVFIMTSQITPLRNASGRAAMLAAALGLIVSLSTSSQATDFFKADNQDNLNLNSSWTNGTPPTASDVAVWDLTVATAVPQAVFLGADASWSGIRIADPAGAVRIMPGNVLTLGAAGIDTSLATQPLTLSNAVVTSAAQIWNLGSGLTLAGPLTNTSTLQKTGGGTLTLATGTGSAMIQIDTGIVSLNTGGAGLTNALNGGTVNVNQAVNNPIVVMAGGGTEQNVGGNRTWSGNLSGSGPLTVISSSTHTWSGNHSNYSGTITVQGTGALRLSSAAAVNAATTYIFNGGTMNPNTAGPFNLGSLSGASGFLNPGTGRDFVVGFLNTDTTFGGVIGGAGNLIKMGTGTLILSGANTFSGATVISNGVVQIDDGSGTGKLGTGSVTNLTQLVFNRGGSSLVVPNVITGSGSVSNIGFSKVALTGTNTYAGPTIITAGTLAVGSASAVTSAYTVGDSAGFGAVVTSAGATVTEGNVSFGNGCSYEFDLGTFGNPAGTVVTNTGTITLNGDVTVNVLGTNFSNGTITLLRYASRAGAGSFVLGSLPPNVNLVSFNDDTVNKRVTLTITVGVVVDETRRWVGDSLGAWDIGNTGNLIWRVVGTSQITNYNDGDAVLFNDSVTGTTNIDITTTVSPASVLVNNTNKIYTFGGAGAISGATGLTKSGPGTLNITNANSYDGQTAIQGGKVIVAGEFGAIGSGGVTNSGTLVFDRTAATNTLPSTANVSGQISGSGSVAFLGMDSTNTVIQVNVGVAEGNPYSGGTTISNAYVNLVANPSSDATRSAAKSTGLGSGQVIFLGDSLLELEDYGVGNNSAQAGNFAAPLNVPSGQVGTLRTAGRATVSSTLTGSGTFNLVVSYVRDVISGDFSAFTGQLNVLPSPNTTGNEYQIANVLGLPSARVHLTPGVTMGAQGAAGANPVFNGDIIPIGELSGDLGSFISGVGDTSRNVIFRVGGLNTSTVFAGNFGGGHGLIKEGTGTFTLSGTNTYTGSTTVSNGVLALIGDANITNSSTVSLVAPGILNVVSNGLSLGTSGAAQTLRGNGTLHGSLTVGSQGSVAPGFSIGTLTVTNTVALGGSTLMELNRSVAPNSDRLVSPAITSGGALVVTNIGVGLQAGDTFQLFSTALAGSFASVELPTNDVVNNLYYTWNTNNLYSLGQIAVATVTGGINPTPTNIIFSAAGGSLSLSWPDHLGWILQSQTNVLGVGLSTNWLDVPGSAAITSTNIALNAVSPTVFYRLRLP
jgi:fibronectin-binding autotransporter adhesin